MEYARIAEDDAADAAKAVDANLDGHSCGLCVEMGDWIA
jgi:hypothetical protein